VALKTDQRPASARRRRGRLVAAIAGLLVVAAAVAVAALAWPRATANSGADRTATESIVVASGSVEGRAVASGSLALVATTTILPKASGELREFRVAANDEVAQGQIIAVLDTSELKADLIKAELDLDTRKAELAKAKAPYTESDLSAARASVAAANAKLQLATAPYTATEIAAAEVAVAQAKLKLDQTVKPYKDSEIAAQRTAVAQAEFQLESARNNLVVVQKGATVSKNVRDAEYEHNFYEVNYGKVKEQMAGGQADENKVSLAWNNLMSAKEKLDTARAQSAQALAAAENQIAQAETSLATAREKLATMTAAADALDLRAANVAIAQAEAKVATMRAGASSSDVESARAALQSAEQKLASMQAGADELSVRIAQNALDSAQATLNDLRAQIAANEVKSPVKGTVVSLGASGTAPAIGSSVTQATVLATVADLSKLQVNASVNEVDAAQVRRGQVADVQLTALPGRTFVGKVTSIDSQATTAQGVVTYGLIVTLDADAVKVGLKPGMSASARVLTGKADNAVLVPVDALQRSRGAWAVLVRGAGGSLETRPVELGIVGTTHAEVTKGLAAGDSIEVPVVRGASSTQNQRQQVPGQPQSGGVPQIPINTQPRR
jgi:RND family efflux transporter MFP subunit